MTPEIEEKLINNLKSLKILFVSICSIYLVRFIQFTLQQFSSRETADLLDPLIVFCKVLLVTGICLSIYIKVKSDNGNLQADVDIRRNASLNIFDETNEVMIIEKTRDSLNYE